MNKIIEFSSLSLVMVFILLIPAIGHSHTLWINATDYTPEFHPEYGAETNVYFGWGHHYPVDSFLAKEDLDEFSLISPDGKIEKLSPNEGGFLATAIKFSEPGGYIVSAVLKPGFYTMYIEDGKIHHKSAPKTGLKGVIMSFYYEQYSKCLIDVGDASDASLSKPVGHRLEIIPLNNPYELHGCGGHFLNVKVLFDGRPASYCKVYATYSGFSTDDAFACTTTTDSEGVAKIRLTHWGPWLIKTEMRLPPTDEIKNKCDEMYYTATLTFEIP